MTKRFGDAGIVAFDGINLEILEHEVICILGPSGCGKTTLLRVLDGLLEPDAGEVLIDGRPVTGPSPDVAMVFQQFNLFPWKRLADNVAYGLRLRGRPRQEIQATVEHYIRMVGLAGFEHCYPYQLSGGMQQRAGLARALAVNPAVLLMDEPFGSLDAQTRETLQEELLRILEREPKTVVFVTHSVDEAILLGDRIVLMTPRPGRVREILEVDIPRPRDITHTRAHPRALALHAYIWDELKRGAGRSVAEVA
ncbi:MAG TPA: ABC transporter ATP-binding protein [Thermodesulfobacteriota bacterium]|nr:ABC transporter ATP-binding protein [Thermodesulfobacteriota bacterium]